MRSNERLERILDVRHLRGMKPAAAMSGPEPASATISDLRLFAFTFAAGFLFTSVFIG